MGGGHGQYQRSANGAEAGISGNTPGIFECRANPQAVGGELESEHDSRSARCSLQPQRGSRPGVFFRDVLDYPFVDAGYDWLIFALPPAELAIHPADSNGGHELFLMCDDVEAFIAQMSGRGVFLLGLAERTVGVDHAPNASRWRNTGSL
jgi:hypothetical protein